VNSLATTYGITRDNPASAATDEGGFVVLTAPAPGTYEAHALLFSNRDEDVDGIENQLDPCSTQGNPDGWSPFVNAPTGDADQDGLPGVCDPNDDPNAGGFNDDQDGDGFLNRGDNCPLIADTPGPTAQDDVDRDGIGNLCDPSPGVPSADIAVYPGYPATLLGSGPVVAAIMGDTNCSGGNPNSVDALHALRYSASLEPYGACVNVAGDVDCDGLKNSIDALRILRYSASLSNTVVVGCTLIGDPIP
jgi:hypothetical protein